MRGAPVFTAKEMRQVEARAFAAGESDELYMENAGKGIAKVLEEDLKEKKGDPVHLLIGKGNNGGDAFVAGSMLIKKGFEVIAYLLFPLEECSPLSLKMGKRFEKQGGELKVINKAPQWEKGLIVDGLLGTGFFGEVKGLFLEVIEEANRSKLPIYAIDIPSGLNGDTGEVGRIAIEAQKTLCLGCHKLGFYLRKGWDHVGKVELIDFGMPSSFFEEDTPAAYLMDKDKTSLALPKVIRSRHKYQAGYLLALAGSPSMGGAAMLACLSALRSGAGIVRLFYPKGMEGELASAPYELIKEAWDLADADRFLQLRFKEEEKRAQALLLGPGMGRGVEGEKMTLALLAQTSLPTVVDADALFFLAQNQKFSLPKEVVLTPHHQEMVRLLGEEPNWLLCQAFVEKRELVLVLKGAPTVIFAPFHKPLIIPHGSPAMATAGTGDVLTGLIGSFLAQGCNPYQAAALGVLLHVTSGEIAEGDKTVYSVLATDLIYSLPKAFRSLGVV